MANPLSKMKFQPKFGGLLKRRGNNEEEAAPDAALELEEDTGLLAEDAEAEPQMETEEAIPDAEVETAAMEPEELEPEPAMEEETGGGDADGSLANLFDNSMAEEENSLSAILELVPQVSMSSIIDDLEEIKEMLRGRLEEG